MAKKSCATPYPAASETEGRAQFPIFCITFIFHGFALHSSQSLPSYTTISSHLEVGKIHNHAIVPQSYSTLLFRVVPVCLVIRSPIYRNSALETCEQHGE